MVRFTAYSTCSQSAVAFPLFLQSVVGCEVRYRCRFVAAKISRSLLINCGNKDHW